MKIVHAIHDFLPRHRAGSELYAFHLAREQARRHDVHVLCAEYDPVRPHGSLHERVHEGVAVTELVNNWQFRSFAETYRSPELRRVLARALDRLRPDVLHVHNLLNLSFDLPALARLRGAAVVATVHDYGLVCPSGGQRLHAAEQHLCAWIDPRRCTRCFPASPFGAQLAAGPLARAGARVPAAARGPLAAAVRTARSRFPDGFARAERLLRRASPATPGVGDIERRLEAVADVADAVQLFVAPSAHLAVELVRLGVPAPKVETRANGHPSLATVPRRPSALLRVGFVGTLARHKGVHVLVEAARRLPAARVEIRIAGGLDTFPAYTAELREAARDARVRFLGGFGAEQTPEVYAELDVLAVPSLWYENAPLVIHEAFQAGAPVVGARIGGIPDLVAEGVSGLLVPPGDAAALAAALQRLLDEPGLLERLRAGIPAVRSIEDDAVAWERTYERLRAAAEPRP